MVKRCSTPDRLSLPDPFPAPPEWSGLSGAACFSRCGRYRWWLVRQWQMERSAVLFLGLNPSIANGARDDPTLRRLRSLANRWGHGRLLVLNLFARVATEPAVLCRLDQPVGAPSDAWLATALEWLAASPWDPAGPPPRVWVGWGNQGGLHGRNQQVLDGLRSWKGEVVCLGLTRKGHPRHPLYARANQPPVPFVVSPSPCPASPVDTPSI